MYSKTLVNYQSQHIAYSFQALFTFGTYEVGSRPETGGGGGRKFGGGPDTYCILSAVDIDWDLNTDGPPPVDVLFPPAF